MSVPKWKRFERQIHELHKQFAPLNANIAYDEKILGFDSKTERQIDISIRYQLAGYDLLLIIDCKDYASPLDVSDVGAFKSLASDVRANKAVMISTNGYTPAAIEMARSAGIETRTYVETDVTEWQSPYSIPVLVSSISIRTWNVHASSVPGFRMAFPTHIPFSFIETFALDGTALGPILVLLGKVWHQNSALNVPGTHRVLLAEHVMIRVGHEEFHVRLEANVNVVERHFLGPLPVHFEGFVDEQKDAITTNSLTTDFIDFSAIQRGDAAGWTEITDKDGMAVKVVFRMGVVDALPESVDEFQKMHAPRPA